MVTCARFSRLPNGSPEVTPAASTPGQRRDASNERLEEGRRACRRVRELRQHDLHRQDVIASETGLHAREPDERLDEEHRRR